MHAQAVLALVLAASFSAQPAATQKATPPVTDGWAGWWTVLSNGSSSTAQIEKKGALYHLRMAPYETYTFKEVSPGVLKCESLGVIRRGKLSFVGQREEPVVLKAEFCYAGFYLFYVGPPN